ncbi:amino acid ABC transporter permease [Bacillus aquiflavi]|uniref:Amino acid ABC transporter permease n=1 Tax=Bacillus aquiflavi TaxID=2672567 RepID=A0A6B3VTC2_9BACI|nr:amino acid ABC transporter permease [Bacillus aquiflavi]MBA4537263.1 amino acid ABC transporter permease [Bacillus aquiflavi]NEY81520.1 amino acid ABC transporter permease [Bacillus aquiflavi]UAC49475.1 amino acid ABC transporter permease [Bacillus aquiflavi]
MSMINLEFALEHFPDVVKGVPLTLAIAVVSMILGLVFGLFIALCRIFKVPVLNRFFVFYISFIRGTPLLVQLYIFFYGVPILLELMNEQLGTNFDEEHISPLIYAMIAFSINTSAYQAEIFRASINATNMAQIEAAYSVGMTTAQALRRIIIPQAFVTALPNLGNTFIGLIKATSLAFAVKVVEILALAKIIANDGYRFLEMYLVASIIYWIICLLFEVIFSIIEKRIRRYEVQLERDDKVLT